VLDLLLTTILAFFVQVDLFFMNLLEGCRRRLPNILANKSITFVTPALRSVPFSSNLIYKTQIMHQKDERYGLPYYQDEIALSLRSKVLL
jgi:hypothetical protein